jgi:ribonuclease HI
MIKAWFDGACEPNQDGGKMGCGGIIHRHDEKIHSFSRGYERDDEQASNNIAEYVSFGWICKYLLDHDLTENEIYIFGDSKLVIEQMQGNWAIRSGKYIPYANRCLELLNLFKVWPYLEWIPKEQNSEADDLSRKHV